MLDAVRWLGLVLLGVIATGCPARSVPTPPGPRTAAPPSLLARLEAAPDTAGTVVGTSTAPATIVVVFASWCGHCQRALAMLDAVRAAHPGVRVLGLNYRGHEEYAQRGSAEAVRTYVAANAPWLRVVPADDALFTALGRPPTVPTILVLDRAGQVRATYDRRERPVPTAAELGALLAQLGG